MDPSQTDYIPIPASQRNDYELIKEQLLKVIAEVMKEMKHQNQLNNNKQAKGEVSESKSGLAKLPASYYEFLEARMMSFTNDLLSNLRKCTKLVGPQQPVITHSDDKKNQYQSLDSHFGLQSAGRDDKPDPNIEVNNLHYQIILKEALDRRKTAEERLRKGQDGKSKSCGKYDLKGQLAVIIDKHPELYVSQSDANQFRELISSQRDPNSSQSSKKKVIRHKIQLNSANNSIQNADNNNDSSTYYNVESLVSEMHHSLHFPEEWDQVVALETKMGKLWTQVALQTEKESFELDSMWR